MTTDHMAGPQLHLTYVYTLGTGTGRLLGDPVEGRVFLLIHAVTMRR